jgi:hypothetical protein
MKFSTLLFTAILCAIFCAYLFTPVSAFGETVPRSFCPNRCRGIGHCVNRTLSDATTVDYECDCGYQSKFPDCADQAHLPLLWTILLGIFIVVLFGATFLIFEKCNKAFDTRQKFYSPDSVLVR